MFYSDIADAKQVIIILMSIYFPTRRRKLKALNLRKPCKVYRDVLLAMPRQCCPVQILHLFLFSFRDTTEI